VIRVQITADSREDLQKIATFAKHVKMLASGSFPTDVFSVDGEILVIGPGDKRTRSSDVGMWIEFYQGQQSSEGPWELHEPPTGYLQILGGFDGDERGSTYDIVCEIHDNEHEEGNADLIVRAPEMAGALAAVLLFHSTSPWDDEKRRRWRRLAESEEATTKVLCDLVRRALGQPKLTLQQQEKAIRED
jgi:hypothetical protein